MRHPRLVEPILVTGGTGMLGHALQHLLKSEGYKVLAPGREQMDCTSIDQVLDTFERFKPGAVMHLAGFVRGIWGNAVAGVQALTTNARIQSTVLEACLIHKPETVVVAGTVAAYAYPYIALPLREDHFWAGLPHGSEGFYAAGKRVAVPYLEALTNLEVNARFAVLTNLYGPADHFGERGAHVVPALIGRALEAKRTDTKVMQVWGFPDTTRDFLYSGDAARYLVDLGSCPRTQRDEIIVNVASGVETSMAQLVDEIVRVTGFQGEVLWDSGELVGVRRRSMDVSLLKSISSHAPLTLSVGLDRTVDSLIR